MCKKNNKHHHSCYKQSATLQKINSFDSQFMRGWVKTCLLLIFFIMGSLMLPVLNAQTVQEFEAKMKHHVQSYLMDNAKVEKWKKENTTPFIKMDPTENEDMLNILVDKLKHQFIIDNMDEYKRIYFPEEFSAMMLTDTFICDNGGFEDDFLYYKGYSTLFDLGSTTCTPTDNGNPSVYTQSTLPTTREFEIVTTGTDAVTGLQKVKFGSKALKLNDVYHHSNGGCSGGFAINKIVKRFKVTEENRDFTVWYSIALENPSGHTNTQPFFNISCDLAPLSELCFDADILNCDQYYSQAGCGGFVMDVLDWSCHRIKIPIEEIGNIATLEIVMADCGQGGHNGYAYIDGICEDCMGSALGSVTLYDTIVDSGLGILYRSCDGDSATICGTITFPTLCNEWVLDSLVFQGVDIVNLSVDEENETFCFTLPLSAFGSEDCLYLTAEAYFRSGTIILPPQISNTLEVCKEHYEGYEHFVLIGDCHDNGTPLLSDDYYFVRVILNDAAGVDWTMRRWLDYPYDNEEGIHTVATGTGNADIFLGPFLRQEGGWVLLIDLPGCVFTEHIDPPICETECVFDGYVITNVKCVVDPANTWSFKLYVPGSGSYSYSYPGSGGLISGDFGDIEEIIDLPLTTECIKFTLSYTYPAVGTPPPPCSSEIIVCPPKPCLGYCDLEVYIDEISCSTYPEYSFTLDVTTSQIGKIICYETVDESGIPISGNNTGPSTSPPSGPFEGDIRLIVELCTGTDCTQDCDHRCFKVLYIPQPNCDDWESDKTEIRSFTKISEHTLKVYPNPFINDEFTIVSTLQQTAYTIYNVSGMLVTEGKFKGGEHKVNVSGSPGIYILKYKDDYGQTRQIKIIKL